MKMPKHDHKHRLPDELDEIFLPDDLYALEEEKRQKEVKRCQAKPQ